MPENSSYAKWSSLKPPKSTSMIKIKEKNAQPEEINSVSATLQVISAPLLNKDKYLTSVVAATLANGPIIPFVSVRAYIRACR